MPVSILAKMWSMDNDSAKGIAHQFSLMSLGKISVQKNYGGIQEVGLSIHDLQHDFCRERAQGSCDKKEWHFRLFQGHMPSLSGSIREAVNFILGLKDLLQHISQEWHQEDLCNRDYMFQNLTRHLLESGLILELCSLVLDPKWMYAQMVTGEKSSLKRDISVLETSVSRGSTAIECALHVPKYIRMILRWVESMLSETFQSVQTLSFALLFRMRATSREEPFMRFLYDKIKMATPVPRLVPVTTSFAPAHGAREAQVNIRTSKLSSSSESTFIDYSP